MAKITNGRLLLLAAVATGCAGGDGGGECTSLVDGAWTLGGDALGMEMGATVTMDVAGCTFTISDWSMEMGSLPSGGSVSGAEVTLTGDDDYWATCTGTVSDDGTSVEGACDDGSAFSMAVDAG